MRVRPAVLALITSTILVAACREEGVLVRALTFEGVEAVSESRLRSVLATRASSRFPWGNKEFFDRGRFEEDLKRIVAFYADRGYPDARVASFDVDLNEAQDEVRIRIVIEEGAPVVVERVDFYAFDALRPRQLQRLRERIGVVPGQPRDVANVEAGRDLANRLLRDRGHPYATVQALESPGTEPRSVIITYAAEPGIEARIGPIEVNGNSSVDDDVIVRQLTFEAGDLFRLSRLQESQRRLYGLQLFRFVNVEPAPVENGDPGVVPIRVTVTEGDHRRLNFGVGYGTEEKGRVRARWEHVNFFGAARTAALEGRYSWLEQGARVEFGQPYLFTPHTSLAATAQWWYVDEPAFRLLTRGGRATVTQDLSPVDVTRWRPVQNSLSLTFIDEFEEYSISNEALNDPSFRDELIALGLDPRTGRARGTLVALALDAQRNTTRNLIDARSGYFLNAHLERAGGFLSGDFEYTEMLVEARHFVTVAERVVVAARAKAGSIDAPDPVASHVPFFKRYFAGGSTSVRGWGRFEISPLSGSGLPIGGHSLLEGALELRIPIAGNLGGVLFVDAGNVWANPWDFNLNDLRYAVGPGLRYNTPIGPVRFDFAYQLTPIEGLLVNGEPETRRWRVHFSVGQAF